MTDLGYKEKIEVLNEARKLLQAGWCKNVSAKTSGGRTCEVISPEAEKFCLGGAILRAGYNLKIIENCMDDPNIKFVEDICDDFTLAKPAKKYCNYTAYNDAEETTLEDVLNFVDEIKRSYENHLS